VRSSHIVWNILGLGMPLIIAFLTIPLLLELIGLERFGLLTLAWGLIGYAGVLDLGIGRAVTQKVSALLGSGCHKTIPSILATAVRITIISGFVGFVLITIAALCGLYALIPVTNIPAAEIEKAMLLLAVALPLQAISATYRGINEAYLNFKKISILRIVLGMANFGAPFLMAQQTTELHWLIATLVFSRMCALLFYRHFALQCISEIKSKGIYSQEHARHLFVFGWWVTVSGLLSPILVQSDRFLVGVLISAAAVSAYVIPYEVTVQTLILAGAVTTVIFPAISTLLGHDKNKAKKLFKQWLLYVAIGMGGVTLTLAAIMPYLLSWWVGDYVSKDSVIVGQVLCVGVFFNAIGSMYYSLLHAQGRSKVTALLHMVEVPLFLVLLYFLIMHLGVVGAAIAWSIRMVVDTVGLLFFSRIMKT